MWDKTVMIRVANFTKCPVSIWRSQCLQQLRAKCRITRTSSCQLCKARRKKSTQFLLKHWFGSVMPLSCWEMCLIQKCVRPLLAFLSLRSIYEFWHESREITWQSCWKWIKWRCCPRNFCIIWWIKVKSSFDISHVLKTGRNVAKHRCKKPREIVA